MAALSPELAALVKSASGQQLSPGTSSARLSRVGDGSNNLRNTPRLSPQFTLEQDDENNGTLVRAGTTEEPRITRATGADMTSHHASSLKLKEAKEEMQAEMEKQERLKQEFERLDTGGLGVITTDIISNMIKHNTKVVDHRSDQQIEDMVAALNDVAGVDMSGENVKSVMTFDTFCVLMLSEDLPEKVGDEVAKDLLMLRDVFLEEEAHNLVTDIVRVDRRDLDAEMTPEEKLERRIDPVIGAAIVVNSITIGISTDIEWVGWNILEVIFALVFLTELIVRCYVVGFVRHFFGPEWHWNCFDALIVLMGCVDVVIIVAGKESEADLPGFSVVRMVRLGRLTRMVRLLRMFKELYLMVSGLFNGLCVLVWAMLLLMISIYVVAVLLTQTIGQEVNDQDEALDTELDQHKRMMFSTVPRSMFTVFRCLTAECIAPNGTPLTVHLTEEYGALFVLIYFTMIMVVTFGLFNLIMSTFVDHVLTASKFNDQKIAAARRNETLRVARKLREMLRLFLRMDETGVGDDALHDAAIDITREQFEAACESREIVRLLDDLDVNVADREDLFDVIDADGNERVGIQELISGLMKVRGEARRSDVVATRLALRSMQRNMREMHEYTLQNHMKLENSVDELKIQMDDMMQLLRHQSGETLQKRETDV